MRFLIDVTDLRSPSRNKYKRVLERFLTEISNGKGVAIEIAEGESRIMAANQVAEKFVDIWSTIPRSNSLRLAYWSRAIRVMFLLGCPKLARKILSRTMMDGFAWNFAYSIEIFSVRQRQSIVRALELNSDSKRLSLLHYWLEERGLILSHHAFTGNAAFEISRAMQVTSEDVLVMAGASWYHDYDALIETKSITGFRLVCLIYDILPIDYPSFVTVRQREQYKKFLCDVGHAADLIVTPNHFTASRLVSFFTEMHIHPPAISPISVARACLAKSDGELTQRLLDLELHKKEFMLCVSDFRERKHVLWLYALYTKLGDNKHSFPLLVFVGRITDTHIFRVLSDDPAWGKASVLIEDPSDDELSWLYANAKLCLQPSFEGGLGMAVTEAIRYGRCCIAADAPSLIEASGGYAEHLPRDEMLWAEAICRGLGKKSHSDMMDTSSGNSSMAPEILLQIEALLETFSRRTGPPSAP